MSEKNSKEQIIFLEENFKLVKSWEFPPTIDQNNNDIPILISINRLLTELSSDKGDLFVAVYSANSKDDIIFRSSVDGVLVKLQEDKDHDCSNLIFVVNQSDGKERKFVFNGRNEVRADSYVNESTKSKILDFSGKRSDGSEKPGIVLRIMK